ncbi:sodium:sulfate symporter [Aggregicoccus sp. 17bor-14]|uniref:SLC13 family permease n=1 Tax=Myxococcaceae TaxID=31 RepID=UPI00129C4350|nr:MULTISPECIES: SLC13 family permease [Myxococcaceae]MBF5045699.1 anion permease [Simulacricoccus sp. 17bor-14]MRI91435.1 sodium:sulfate symporter [Aggregicoccus sp. 17bor-14]
MRRALTLGGLLVIGLAALGGLADPEQARAALVVGCVLLLWLSESVPAFVPTLLLLVATPLLLGGYGPEYRLPALLREAADPVLALFFGGFALSVAASRHGIDAFLAQRVVRLARGRRAALLALGAGVTAVLSMWMSNIAAAAMMIAALRPLLSGSAPRDPFRRAMLLSVALGANVGGMATPIGTGPNGLAIAALEGRRSVTFVGWMAFALPLTLGLLAAGLLLLALRYRVRGQVPLPSGPAAPLSPRAYRVMALFFLCVALWLSEPLHRVPSAVVALGAVAALFGLGLLAREDLARVDGATLLLIAGGILLGHVVESAGLVSGPLARLDAAHLPLPLVRLTLVGTSALMAALMSNTGTAALLLPLAAALDPSPVAPVLVAIGASLGMPFAISTPPNAMVSGEGGVSAGDLAGLGLPLMLLGIVVVALSGPAVLRLLGLG